MEIATQHNTTLKGNFFIAVLDSILLYGSKALTLTKKHEKKLDGTYTIMLRAILALNISWKENPTKIRLYGNIPLLTRTLRIRRTRFLGHYYRNKEEIIKDIILWMPNHGTTILDGREKLM